jgi:hypothetical protein
MLTILDYPNHNCKILRYLRCGLLAPENASAATATRRRAAAVAEVSKYGRGMLAPLAHGNPDYPVLRQCGNTKNRHDSKDNADAAQSGGGLRASVGGGKLGGGASGPPPPTHPMDMRPQH